MRRQKCCRQYMYKKIQKNISYTLSFVDNARFMERTLSYLVNKLSVGIHRIKRKFRQGDKECETCGIRYKYFICFFEYEILKMILQDTNACAVTKIINASLTRS